MQQRPLRKAVPVVGSPGGVRDNPVPVALVGTGLVWLMLSSSRSTRREYDDEDDLPEAYGETHYGGGLSEDVRQDAGWGESARETARDLSEGGTCPGSECT